MYALDKVIVPVFEIILDPAAVPLDPSREGSVNFFLKFFFSQNKLGTG